MNVDAVKRVRGSPLAINLLDVVNPTSDLIGRLADDPVFLVDVLYVLCKPQADAQGITDEQFGQAMGGDVLSQAVDELLKEIANFFPNGKRQLLTKMIEKIDKLEAKAIQMVENRLNDPKIDQLMEEQLKVLFGDLPESLDSTPAPLPSVS